MYFMVDSLLCGRPPQGARSPRGRSRTAALDIGDARLSIFFWPPQVQLPGVQLHTAERGPRVPPGKIAGKGTGIRWPVALFSSTERLGRSPPRQRGAPSSFVLLAR